MLLAGIPLVEKSNCRPGFCAENARGWVGEQAWLIGHLCSVTCQKSGGASPRGCNLVGRFAFFESVLGKQTAPKPVEVRRSPVWDALPERPGCCFHSSLSANPVNALSGLQEPCILLIYGKFMVVPRHALAYQILIGIERFFPSIQEQYDLLRVCARRTIMRCGCCCKAACHFRLLLVHSGEPAKAGPAQVGLLGGIPPEGNSQADQPEDVSYLTYTLRLFHAFTRFGKGPAKRLSRKLRNPPEVPLCCRIS